VDSPSVVGWLRPVILLPAATLAGLTPMQLEAILAHEIAHIKRFDYLVNILQMLVETLLFTILQSGGRPREFVLNVS
jgi:beta-lactamase regulating signal transducer with metallopeptidase domain